MDSTAILRETREFIAANFLAHGDDGKFANDASLLGEGLIDSTGILELVSHLETKYAIQVLDEEMTADNLDSVVKIAEFVRSKLSL